MAECCQPFRVSFGAGTGASGKAVDEAGGAIVEIKTPPLPPPSVPIKSGLPRAGSPLPRFAAAREKTAGAGS